MMVLLGAHYLPFIFLYGMAMFGILAGVLIVLGLGLAHLPDLPLAVPAWITGTLLLAFAGIGEKSWRRSS